MRINASDTDELLGRAAQGDAGAVGTLLNRHRPRLRQMIAVRLDTRVMRRIDPSDVVQESLTAATQLLSEYLRTRPLPFYPWLRQIAWNRLAQLHEQHIGVAKRTIEREQRIQLGLSDASVAALARRLISPASSPSHALLKAEQRSKVRAALDVMPTADREVLVMWYLEELSVDDIAAVLELTPAGVKSRHRRALLRLTRVLTGQGEKD